MNPQVSPWMKIADHMSQGSIKRQQEQRQLQRIAKLSYQKQLKNQLQMQRQLKKRVQQEERQRDRTLIRKSMEDQQKIFQIEHLKQRAANQKQMKLDFENQYYQRERRQKQRLIKGLQQNTQMQRNVQNAQKLRKQRQQQQTKREELRNVLKDTIQYKQNHKKLLRQQQRQFDRYKLSEQQILNQRRQHQRQQFLLDLKRRSETIDYGSHNAVEKINSYSLVEKKKQQWRAHRQNIQYQEKLRDFEKNDRIRRSLLQKHYRDQLRNQIRYNEQNKSLRNKIELQNDRIQSYQSQQYAKSFQDQRREAERQKQQILNEELSYQMQEKSHNKKIEPYAMQDKQFKLNLSILRGNSSIIPGQTNELDFNRKKQLQTVARSMGSPLNINSKNSSRNYLAEKGLSIFQK